MAQSSIDIGTEVSIIIQVYIPDGERKLASINQATKMNNEGNQMGAT
jgi:hypothetical protein